MGPALPILSLAVPIAAYSPAQGVMLPLLALAYWLPYTHRTRTLAAAGRPVSGWRRACFAAGLLICAVALSGPVGTLSDELLTAHMVEHLMLGDIAALLLVLGLTVPILQPLLRIKPIDRLRVLTNPLVALPVWALNFSLWHLPIFYEAALRNDFVHAIEHATFIGFGMAMWMALLGPFPRPAWFGSGAKLIYIVIVRLVGTVLGNVFMWSGVVFYPYYARGEARFGISPIGDQSIAGVVMMIEESLITLGLLSWLFFEAAKQGEERQALLDYAQQHDLELTDARAARAVAAGRGSELRERLETPSDSAGGNDELDQHVPTA